MDLQTCAAAVVPPCTVNFSETHKKIAFRDALPPSPLSEQNQVSLSLFSIYAKTKFHFRAYAFLTDAQ